MSSLSAIDPSTAPRRWLPLLLAYPVLAMAGVLTHRQGFSLAAGALLLTVLMAPALSARRMLPWAVWLLTLAGMAWLWMDGMVGRLLECVPIAVNVMLALLFGRSLRHGSMPLIARFIEAVEGRDRLQAPGLARYARQLTWFWTLLLASQALVLSVLLLCAEPAGLLGAFGLDSPVHLPAGWTQAYVHIGGYVLIGSAFVLEHAFRRWHLRHLEHPRMHNLVIGIVARWPQLVRGEGSVSS